MPDGIVPSLEDGLRLCSEESRGAMEAALGMLNTDGTPFDVEVESDTFAGRRLWVRVCGEAERQDDGHGTLQDLTERRSLEQQFLRAQRLDSIGTLAGGIAHDLNNVLSPIVLSVEMLKETVQGPFDRELLNTIEASARRGAEMVRQVLAFARGVEGHRVAVSVGRIVQEVERIANDTFLESIQVRTEIAEGR